MNHPALPDSAECADLDARCIAAWQQLACGFATVAAVFADCYAAARQSLTDAQLAAYLDAARQLGKLGRGAEPMLAFLEGWPEIVAAIGDTGSERLLAALLDAVRTLQKSPNGRAIAPLLQTLAAVARRLGAATQLAAYLDLVLDLAQRTTTSLHGRLATQASPGLPAFLAQAPWISGQLPLDGISNWVDYGVRNYAGNAERQIDYFMLQSADSRAVVQRERHGTLLADVGRELDLTLRALWDESLPLLPYASGFAELRQPQPYADRLGLHLPDALEARSGVSGSDRYRAIIAHLAAHRRWSQPLVADNWSPLQRLAVEFFEDCRVDLLAIRTYPGLRRLFLALHPQPQADACDALTTSCLRHRLAMLSRALLDPDHGYRDPDLLAGVQQFSRLLDGQPASTAQIAELAIAYVARTRRQSDQLAKVYFTDTLIDYRDDNRQLWLYIENGDEEESFATARSPREEGIAASALPPRHYPEWDYASASYRPDWVSVYEALHPAGDAGVIDALLARHSALGRRLKRLIDELKPQDKVRLRYQQEGSELDLDVAVAALVDLHAGRSPETRINVSHRRQGRDVAVLLLLDLSASLGQRVAGSEQTILQLSQQAVALLAWAVDAIGDPLAIAGFHSNTRHQVRYLHIKGYSEAWGDPVKARLAALSAGYSTRLGAALRHAAHYIEGQTAERKLLLVVTDGEPADVDSPDPRSLLEDARQAVRELDGRRIYTHCINLDPGADDYVGQIFGRRYTVIDTLDRLPEQLPQIFLRLTR